ncbi:MAG: DUF2188 domain-containing protein [Betaproteobacteria bacterium]
MAKKSDIHVVPHDKGWAVQREGATRPSSLHDTKADAIAKAKPVAKREQLELVIHTKDGKISNPNSYGNDPNPPKDKKK